MICIDQKNNEKHLLLFRLALMPTASPYQGGLASYRQDLKQFAL